MKTNRMKKFTPYFYILPTFIILAVVIVIPIIYVIIQSFYTTFANESVFVGLRNYKMAFEDELLLTALKNNLKLFLCVPILTVLSLAIASILYNKIRGWRFYRSVIFIPYILAIPVVGIVFSYLLQYNGVINSILRTIGLENMALDWLGTDIRKLGSEVPIGEFSLTIRHVPNKETNTNQPFHSWVNGTREWNAAVNTAFPVTSSEDETNYKTFSIGSLYIYEDYENTLSCLEKYGYKIKRRRTNLRHGKIFFFYYNHRLFLIFSLRCFSF